MSPAQIILLFIVTMVATFALTRWSMGPTSAEPKPKRFGLKEAEAAAEIANAAARELGAHVVVVTTAKALKEYTVRVLGYQDVVEPEFSFLVDETSVKNEKLRDEIANNGNRIENLKAKIRGIEGENEQLTLYTIAFDQRLAKVKADVALFS